MADSYPSDWDTRRRKVYRRDGFQCQNCGAKGGPRGNVELHAHHVVPKSKGGTHRLRNLTTVCKACHQAIHGSGTAPTAIEEGDLSERVRRAIERHYRTDETQDGFVRLGKNAENPSPIQNHVDSGRNRREDGCPACGKSSLTVSWVGIQPGKKAKVIECTDCSSQYEERVISTDGQTERALFEVADPTEIPPVRSAVLKELKDQFRLWLNR